MSSNKEPAMMEYLSIRISSELKTEFKKRAKLYGPPNTMLRELIQAFVEGRLVITAYKPDEKGPLYVSRTTN